MPGYEPNPTSLREALLERCKLAGWTPLHLGDDKNEAGLEEALKEIIATREAEATLLSLELIEECEALQWRSPWLLDNRARCLVHQGRDDEAMAIWRQLLGDDDAAVAAIAADTIQTLERRDSMAVQANRIRQLQEENQLELWQSLLLNALLEQSGKDTKQLQALLTSASANIALADSEVWDPDFLRHELMLQLFEQGLKCWEDALS